MVLPRERLHTWRERRGLPTLVGVGLLVTGVGGCGASEALELVALRGCGLEQEFSALRVRVVGDLPAASGTELLLGPQERGRIEALPVGATGIVAQGLFGTTVTAVGRSWGIDPEVLAGRVPGTSEEGQGLPLWFAAPDSLCTIEAQPEPLIDVGSAVGPLADLVLAGGADGEGELRDTLEHVDLLDERARELALVLPAALRAPEVWARGGRSFALLAGGGAGEVSATVHALELDGPSLVVLGELEHGGQAWARAGFASARVGATGRVLLAGGCASVDASGRCDPSSAASESAWFDPVDATTQELPSLASARASALAFVSVDGLAFVAGGIDSEGEGLGSVERLLPGADSWELIHELPERRIVGLTVLDGGLVLLVDELGLMHWWSEAGSGSLDPSSRAPALAAGAGADAGMGATRALSTLPGERVLVDGWLFSPATAAVDPALERTSLATPRIGVRHLSLADGSTLLVGGLDPLELTPLEPVLRRLRPALDGPDEWIPELTSPQTDAFVGNAPGLARVSVGGLRLEALEGSEIARARAHVRGFRSTSFRFEFGFEAEAGVTAELILGQGSAALASVALEAEGPSLRTRGPDGELRSPACEQGEGALEGMAVVEIDEGGRSLRLLAGATQLPILSCELDWPVDEGGLYVGFGARGAGAASFFGLRLARR